MGYEYIGEDGPWLTASGTIPPGSFTDNYPVTCTSYSEDESWRNDLLEITRREICQMLDYMQQFLKEKQLGITLKDMGFTKY